MLIDRARIHVRAGNGGNGSMSFRREKFVPKGGPDGGDGGRGGDVVLQVAPNITSLIEFQYNQKFAARNGQNGTGRKKTGKSAPRLTIRVPAGTVVWDDDTGELLADLTDEGETFRVARGGRGGLGNVHFKTSMRQAPRIAELGEPGEERTVRLELRLIADVGLVGLPNAGKSTLLAASTRATPKIADYPFTTLEPNLGVVQIGGRSGPSFVMADIPGLIEGAADGTGLGHDFLRHISRTAVLIHVLDASGGLEGRDPMVDFETINNELRSYDSELAQRPMLVALNKVDLTEAQERLPALEKTIQERGYRTYEISAATGHGVSLLLEAAEQTLQEARAAAVEVQKPQERRLYTLDEADERAFTVTRRGASGFTVTGGAIERLTRMTNFDQMDSVDRYQRVLERSGISDELEEQGIEPGDIVTIAGHELTWGEEFELPELPDRRTAKERRYGPQTGEDELEGEERFELVDLDDEDYETDDDVDAEDGEDDAS
ncbi:MAG: GTPase ObgE [Thermomicrobiales bacterium]|nr:GTPase ObgE [Thermomicrobiales bacterium]